MTTERKIRIWNQIKTEIGKQWQQKRRGKKRWREIKKTKGKERVNIKKNKEGKEQIIKRKCISTQRETREAKENLDKEAKTD